MMYLCNDFIFYLFLSRTYNSKRLSVDLHATGASGEFGFVAEVLTIPISNIGIGRDVLHNFTYNEFYGNEKGAIFSATAGEVGFIHHSLGRGL